MNDFDKLKDLLFGAEKQALDSISERVERPETRAADVADILPESIYQSHKKNSELVESLIEPVGECLRQAFHDDPQTYGDALYPAIGPAIRRSISQTLRAFSQQINQAVEQSLTPKGLKWRLQAYRAGVPFGEYMLQKTLLYRVEQAYLISRENGLLVEHVHHSESKIKDSDAVSAMFTAIQDFVKESFSPDRTGRLESADMGEFTLWAVHGPHALLVCVIRGVPPKTLRSHLSAILERIHFRYGDSIRNYVGDTSSLAGVDTELEKCLGFQATEEESKKRGSPWLVSVIGLSVISLLLLWAWNSWTETRQLTDLTTALSNTPGMYVKDVRRDGDQILIQGMKDPLATPVSDIATDLGIGRDRVLVKMQAFQSLEPEIVKVRVENMLRDMDAIGYELVGTTLTLNGTAPRAWTEDIRPGLMAIAGIDTVDLASVVDSDLSGIRAQVEALSGSRFLFTDGTTMPANQEAALRDFSRDLSALQSRAAASKHIIEVTITGSTDSLGMIAANARLAVRRGNVVAMILSERGISGNVISAPISGTKEQDSSAESDRRSAVVSLELLSSTNFP